MDVFQALLFVDERMHGLITRTQVMAEGLTYSSCRGQQRAGGVSVTITGRTQVSPGLPAQAIRSIGYPGPARERRSRLAHRGAGRWPEEAGELLRAPAIQDPEGGRVTVAGA